MKSDPNGSITAINPAVPEALSASPPRPLLLCQTGKPASISWRTTGAVTSYVWSHDSVPLAHTADTLFLPAVSAADLGSYTVTVSDGTASVTSAPVQVVLDDDEDGMADDWEITQFGDLDELGTADFDADGSTNQQEFADGTDPKSNSSLLHGLTLDKSARGTIAAAPSGPRHPAGTSVTVTPTSVHGLFRNWTGSDTTTANPLALTMNAPKSLGAEFDELVIWGQSPQNDDRIFDAPDWLGPVTMAVPNGAGPIALMADGTLARWNEVGAVAMPQIYRRDVVAVAAGWRISAVLYSDGTVMSWPHAAPAGLSGVVKIACGRRHVVALKKNGTVLIWGESYPVPSDPGLGNIVDVAAASNGSLAVKSDGSVIAWGGSPSTPAGLSGVRAIAAGPDSTIDGPGHVLALKRDGTVVTWGQSDPIPVGLADVVDVSCGDNLNLAHKADGTWVSWAGPQSDLTPPAGMPAALPYIKASGGALAAIYPGQADAAAPRLFHPYFLHTSVGIPVRWKVFAKYGATSFSASGLPDGLTINASTGEITGTATAHGEFAVTIQAGNATGTSVSQAVVNILPPPALVAWSGTYGAGGNPPALSRIVSLSAHGELGLVAHDDGTVSAWGSGPGLAVPVGLTGVVQVAAGGYHGVALKEDGTVVCWGNNNDGRATPPPGLDGVVRVAAGDRFSMALKRDGTVVLWGRNEDFCWLGPPELTKVSSIVGRGPLIGALRTNGTASIWGYAPNWQSWWFDPVLNATGLVEMDFSGVNVLARRADGTMVAGGLEQHGLATVPPANSPGLAIATAENTHCVVKPDGTLAVWGESHPWRPNPVPEGLPRILAMDGGWGFFAALTTGEPSDPKPHFISPRFAIAEKGLPAYVRTPAQNLPDSYSSSGLPPGLSISATGEITGTPSVAGGFDAVLSATNEAGTGTRPLRLHVLGSNTFASWMNAFGITGPAAAATADANGNGWANLLDYAFGLDVRMDEPTSNPSGVVSGTLNAENRLSITFPRDPTKADIVYTVEFSDDLVTWEAAARSEQGQTTQDLGPAHTVSETNLPDGRSQVTVSDGQAVGSGGAKRFGRVRVVLSSP